MGYLRSCNLFLLPTHLHVSSFNSEKIYHKKPLSLSLSHAWSEIHLPKFELNNQNYIKRNNCRTKGIVLLLLQLIIVCIHLFVTLFLKKKKGGNLVGHWSESVGFCLINFWGYDAIPMVQLLTIAINYWSTVFYQIFLTLLFFLERILAIVF